MSTEVNNADDKSNINPFTIEIADIIWRDKYRWRDENNPVTTLKRVADAICTPRSVALADEAFTMMEAGLLMPAGRILAGAGTDKNVTLMNCYVDRTIDDSMIGIKDALGDAMLTMQRGGGIGMDFSTLRPNGARTTAGSPASGPLPFMDMWDAMCATIMSAGSRRGAMMGTLCDSHPDLIDFIVAKKKPGRLTNFNLSILISDAFMDAVNYGEEWVLYFHEPPAPGVETHGTFEDNENVTQHIYSVWKAAELWDIITKNTYEYSEPGVIFIDRINDEDPLNYCEEIRCTNPCGEQPLPPNGACDLGAVNLARMVANPFSDKASFDFVLLGKAVRLGVQFLDCVIDVCSYPLVEQQNEQLAKRRIGLGVAGLGSALAMMGIRYGSEEAETLTRSIFRTIANTAYEASAYMAKLIGTFPLYDAGKHLQRPFIKQLSPKVQDLIKEHGLRNGVLLTVAPTGTTSLLYGNISGGVEPVFSWRAKRKILQPGGSRKEHVVQDYALSVYQNMFDVADEAATETFMKQPWAVTSNDLKVEDHVRMQAAAQQWVDASISKTINCPKDIEYEDFKRVYLTAYELGCKGCTTYRPSDVRDAVLVNLDGSENGDQASTVIRDHPQERPSVLRGTTYKIKWPSVPSALYVTINETNEGQPFEIFIACKSSQFVEWTTALTLMITALMRQRIDIKFIPRELKQVVSNHDTAWVDKKHYGSLVAYIGQVLERHINGGENGDENEDTLKDPDGPLVDITNFGSVGAEYLSRCNKCGAIAVQHAEGCDTCLSCGTSTCA